MASEFKYIGYYDTKENAFENRMYSLAATNKMDYICNVLNRNGYKVLIISPSRTLNNSFYKGKKVKINDNTELKLFPSLPLGNKIQRAFAHFAGDIMLFWYLLTKVKKDETILVYHSLAFLSIVRIAKKIKRFKIVLEVEEIYQDVEPCSKRVKRNEYRTIESAERYIFSTELLNQKVNLTNKPFSIIYGTYKVEEDCKKKFNDGKIHVVYAGTLNSQKGSLEAIASAEFLPFNYHIHIIGFGTEEEMKKIKDEIERVSQKSAATVTFDGLLKGKEYTEFLQKCDIGLSTQNPDAVFNDTSFPSKIFSYLSNGLRVVSIRLKAIEESTINKDIVYYDTQTPSAIAEVIESIDLSKEYDSRKILKKLDQEFVGNFDKLLRN